MKLGFREKTILFGAALVIITVGWYFLYIAPKRSDINTLQTDITRIEADIRRSEPDSIMQLKIESLQKEINVLLEETQKSEKFTVTKESMLSVNELITEKISQFNLENTGRISPNIQVLFNDDPADTLQTKYGIKPVDIDLFLKGEFNDIVRFLESFSSFPFHVRVGSIDLSTDDDLYPDLIIMLKVYVFVRTG